MQAVTTLLNLACGQPLPESENTRARRLQLAVAAAFGALLLAALWGLAAGSSDVTLALSNTLKVPLVVLLSAVAAVPAGMLTWKLTGVKSSGTELIMAFSTAIFSGTMVMGALSPVVALYYHSSTWAGPMLGMGSVAAGILLAIFVFVRRTFARAPKDAGRLSLLFPVLVFVGVNLAALLQLVALAAPILPELTAFDGGIDRLMSN